MLKRCFVADLKKSWYQYFIVIALLTIICVVGVAAFTLDRTIFDYMTYDDEKYMDISAGYISNKEIYDELDRQGRILGMSNDHVAFVTLENTLVDLFHAPLSKGKWFDGNGLEIIIRSSLADEYPIGSKVNVGIGKEAYATVVGHFKYDTVLAVGSLYSNSKNAIGTLAYDKRSDFLINGDDREDYYKGTIVARLTAEEIAQYREYKDFNLFNVYDEFQRYLYYSGPEIALAVYVFFALFAGTAIVILSTTMAGGELQKRRIAITMVCGVNQKSLMITEVIKSVICLVVSAVIGSIIVFNVKGGTILKLHSEHLYKSLLVMLMTSAIICLVNIIKIKRTNMLDIIGGK